MARLQLRPNATLEPEETHLEGELFWDSTNRFIGAYNFSTNLIDWFRLPRTSLGESISYIPTHEIDAVNYRFRFQDSDGEYGDWIVSPTGPIGPPANLIPGDMEFVETIEEAEFSLEGDAPNFILNLKIPRGPKGDNGDNSVLPIVSVAMLPIGSSPALVNTGTSEEPAYRLDIPYGSTPVEYSILIEDTSEIDIMPGEYFVTRFAAAAFTTKKMLAEVMNGTGEVEIYLLVNGLAVAGPLTVTSSAVASIEFSLNVAVDSSVSFMVTSVTDVSSVWIQLVGEL